jgi:hypothetical protein
MTRRIAVAALVALSACGSTPGRAQRIGTRPDGGSIMLSANNDKAWDQARDLMTSHCDGKYRVVGQVKEQSRGPGGPPAATPGAMADPVGAAGAPYGIRVDYECIAGTGPVQSQPQTPPASQLPPVAPSAPPKSP